MQEVAGHLVSHSRDLCIEGRPSANSRCSDVVPRGSIAEHHLYRQVISHFTYGVDLSTYIKRRRGRSLLMISIQKLVRSIVGHNEHCDSPFDHHPVDPRSTKY